MSLLASLRYPLRMLAAYHPALQAQSFSSLAASRGRMLIPALYPKAKVMLSRRRADINLVIVMLL